MRKLFLTGMITLLAFVIAQPTIAKVTAGEAAPDFTAMDALSGKEIRLSDLKGKLVVLEWSNPKCPFVQKFYSVGAMQQLQQNATKKGVVWISVNSSAVGKEGHFESDAAAKSWVAEQKGAATHMVRDADGAIGQLYGAKTTPHMFVIDKEVKLAYMGAIDSIPSADSADIATAKNYVTAALIALTENKPVTLTNTKPYGCSVKYQ